MLRTSILDASGQYWLGNIPWQEAMTAVLNQERKNKVMVIEEYDEYINTGNSAFKIKKPKWVIKLHANCVRSMLKKVPPTLENVYKEYEGICAYCACQTVMDNKPKKGRKHKSNKATRDHIWPRCRGGQNEWKNFVLACGRCNEKKAGKSPEEAGMKLLVHPKIPKVSNGLITITEAERRGLLA